MRSRKLALVIAPFLLLSLLPGVVTAAQPKDTKAAHHAKVVKYWTPERIKNAKPRDFVFDPAKGTYKPAAKPAPPSGGGNVTGASWTGAGDILKGTGRVLFTLGGSRLHLLRLRRDRGQDAARSIVLTAGHCASENDGADQGDELDVHPVVRYAPSYTCANDAVRLLGRRRDLRRHRVPRTPAGSTTRPSSTTGRFAVVSTGGKTGHVTAQLDATVGVKFPIAFTGRLERQHAERLRVPGGRPLQGQGPDVLPRPDRSGRQHRQHHLVDALQHDRRLVRRPVGLDDQHDDRTHDASRPCGR